MTRTIPRNIITHLEKKKIKITIIIIIFKKKLKIIETKMMGFKRESDWGETYLNVITFFLSCAHTSKSKISALQFQN